MIWDARMQCTGQLDPITRRIYQETGIIEQCICYPRILVARVLITYVLLNYAAWTSSRSVLTGCIYFEISVSICLFVFHFQMCPAKPTILRTLVNVPAQVLSPLG